MPVLQPRTRLLHLARRLHSFFSTQASPRVRRHMFRPTYPSFTTSYRSMQFKAPSWTRSRSLVTV